MSAAELGWIGQALFALRFALQWLASERAGESVVPPAFWWLSLAGALLLAVYTTSRSEGLLTAGYLANAWIYARNLSLRPGAAPQPPAHRIAELLLLSGLLALGAADAIADARSRPSLSVWLGVLLLGQLLWNARFAVQWAIAQRSGRTLLTPAFWWSSLAGNLLLLAYALHLGDAVLICAFAFGPIVQTRNLVLALAR